ncbi:MAG: hypothetical protein K1W28_15420 [Lachnospiraceae bacterium]
MLHVLASSGAGVAASGALTDAMLTAIEGGFNTLSATVGQVIPLVVTASVSVICLTAGVNYALKKIRGVLSKAS